MSSGESATLTVCRKITSVFHVNDKLALSYDAENRNRIPNVRVRRDLTNVTFIFSLNPAPNNIAVSVRNLWMSFLGKRRDEQIAVLEDVNLDVREGEFVCIVGPSGCGKSTLLNIIAGFLQQTRGQVVVEDQPVRGPDPRHVFVFQENGVFPWLTVEGNVGFGGLH
jgi:ABC-type glutathione transport system ATPase component